MTQKIDYKFKYEALKKEYLIISQSFYKLNQSSIETLEEWSKMIDMTIVTNLLMIIGGISIGIFLGVTLS